MSIFAELDVYHDAAPRMAALNMALDEALLERATRPSIRFYQWDHLALSFGYFGKYIDVAEYAVQRDLVRRWTGGGIVFHGDDLTYSVVIPASAEFFSESARSIYAAIHAALRNVLVASGKRAELASTNYRGSAEAAVGGRGAEVTDPGDNERSLVKILDACFAQPVIADVMLNGRKVAGAAQRRTRRGLLQQGSIQQVELAQDFMPRFASELSGEWTAQHFNNAISNRAREIAWQKYGSEAWLRKR
jgi:lipoate-protein ligase A